MEVRFHEITEGLLAGARFAPTENCDDRPRNEISLIVIHCISLPEGHYSNANVESLFCNNLDTEIHPDFSDIADLTVSSHLLIRRDGSVVQFVPFTRRAWHAGESHYKKRVNCNDFSMDIELEGTDKTRFTDLQYDALIAVCKTLVCEYDIPSTAIVGHSDIAPGRKTDPGSRFDWPLLRNAVSVSSDASEQR